MASKKKPSRSSGHVGVVVDHAVYRSFSQFAGAQAWSPAVNVYEVGSQLQVCVDLSGIDREKIDVRIEPGRLTVSGVRHAPEPQAESPGSGLAPPASDSDDAARQMKILTMEVDYGAFQRVIQITQQIDLDRVRSEYRRGLLWIVLPYKK